MKTTTLGAIEELIEICHHRIDFYKELKDKIRDDLCMAIISRFINQGEIFLNEIVEECPSLNETFANVYSYEFINNSLTGEVSGIAFFELCEENEKNVIDSYTEFLDNNTSVPLDMVVSQQLEDIKYCYHKMLSLKQAFILL